MATPEDAGSTNNRPARGSSTTSASLNPDGTAKSSVGEIVVTAKKPKKALKNPLANYSSVTYKISLYATTPVSFNNFYQTGKWDTSTLELLIQSGGITDSIDSPRNQWFNYDFGIDNLEITTLVNTKETGIPSNSIDFKFQVYEPYTMTFPTRLAKVQNDLQRRKMNQQIEALRVPVLLVLRFYGYDANGELVSGNTGQSDFASTNDSTAFERAFPILITKLTFKLENKVTVYDITAKTHNEQVGFGVKRATIQNPSYVEATTVEEALGALMPETGPTNGVFDKINKMYSDLTGPTPDKAKIGIADKYSIRITDPLLAKSLIVDKDWYVKNRLPMSPIQAAADVNVRTEQRNLTVNSAKRRIDFAPGDTLLTIINKIITQSTYLARAMKVIDVEETQPVQENDETYSTQKNSKQLYWYSVIPTVEILGYDEIRKDYAYHTTYIIQRYEIPYIRTTVAGSETTYNGPLKLYEYFYTGQNTEVLNYEQTYNMLYYLATVQGSEAGIPNKSDNAPTQPISGQNENQTGKLPGKNELVNTLTTFLYSPGDQLKAQIRILGDPDYLMTSLTGSVGSLLQETPVDSSIDPTKGQVFIEIDFKQVEDFGKKLSGGAIVTNDNGLMEPNSNILFWEYPKEIEEVTNGRMVYMVTRVVSKFSKGLFTQDLRTILPNFIDAKAAGASKESTVRETKPAAEAPKSGRQNQTATQTPQTTENESAAETARLKRQNEKVVLPALPNRTALVPVSPDDPGQRRILKLPLNSEGRPVIDIPNTPTLLPPRGTR